MKKLNQIRLLHVVGDSGFGGASKIILRLAEMAKAEGCEADILTTNRVFQEAARQRGIGVIDLDVIRREIRPLWDLPGLIRLYTFLRQERYTVVHTHTSKAGFVGRLAARLAGVPVILHTIHGFAFHERSPLSTRSFYSALERAASHWCDRIVSVSEFHRHWALELGICGPGKIVAIPNGIARPAVSSRTSRHHLQRQWGVQPADLVILSTGRLAEEKGLEDLIAAASILRRAGQGFRVVLAGNGPLRARLERLARDLDVTDQVTFLGYREDIPDLLAACDLVVLPSLREGLSIALLEAMAAGKPIVATNIGSNVAVASQADMALVVPPCDPQALAEATLRCGRDPDLRSRLASNARLLFESRYTEDRMLNSYLELYLDLLQAKCDARAPVSERVEPGVLRRAEQRDLPAIVTIHQKAFGNFFLTRLGRAFLYRYYALVLQYGAGILLVSEGSSGLQGFVCGFGDPDGFYQLMSQNRRVFALPILSAMLRHPSLVAEIVDGVRWVERQAFERCAQSCELSSVAVHPEAGGAGVGTSLLQAFLEAAWSLGVQYVFLNTDADDNEAANALYRKAGFQLNRKFQKHGGRWMNEYALDREIANEEGVHESAASRY